MKCIIYVRVSTEEQETDVQEDICVKHCVKKGYTYEVFRDKQSGTLPFEQRTVLGDAIDKCVKGDVFLVHKPDRLARSEETPVIRYLLRKKDVKLEVLEGVEQDNTPIAKLMQGVLDLISSFEVAMIQTRTRNAMKLMKERKERTGTIPYGYTLDTTKTRLTQREEEKPYKLIPEPQEQEVITRMKALYFQGNSLRKIVMLLEKEGYSNRVGGVFQVTSVRRILERENVLQKDLSQNRAA